MKISIDIDNCFLEYPVTFANMAKMFQKSGHHVGILTGRSPSNKVNHYGFKPDFEYYLGSLESGVEMKTRKIMQENIDIHFDDQADEFRKDLTVIKIT